MRECPQVWGGYFLHTLGRHDFFTLAQVWTGVFFRSYKNNLSQKRASGMIKVWSKVWSNFILILITLYISMV